MCQLLEHRLGLPWVEGVEAFGERTIDMRASSVANRLRHTDASFVDPPGRYSMLSARVVPPVKPPTGPS
jgi:hypothetical protein